MPLVPPSFDETADCVEVLDASARVLWANASRRHLCDSANLACYTGSSWLEWWDADFRAMAAAGIVTATQTGVHRFTATGITQADSTTWWDVTLTRRLGREDASPSFLSVARDVTAYVRSSAQRDAAANRERALRRQIEMENQKRDYALLVAAHELGAPLYAVRGWAQYLQLGNLASEDVAEAVAAIGRNTDRQHYLVERLLEIARFRSRKTSFALAPHPLTDILIDAIESVRPVASVKQIPIQANVATNAWVSADFDQLQRAFSNILFNAVKFNQRGGVISVNCTVGTDRVHVEFSDTGTGIAPSFLEKVFDPFTQEAGATTVGMGVGLAIVRRIVEGHHGRVLATSQGPGSGARFVVDLPLFNDAEA